MWKNHDIFLERLNSLKGRRTVSKFADDCKIPQQTMSVYCKGERIPGLEALEKIATTNVVSADWLLGFTDDPKGTAAPATDPTLAALIAEKDAEIARLKGKIEGLELAFKAFGKGK